MTRCKRHRRGILVGWMPVDNERGTSWAIVEVYRCSVCDHDMAPRVVAGTYRRTQRDAMVAYGLAPEVIEGFFPPAPAQPPASASKSEPISAPLTSWPFPVSSRTPEKILARTAGLVCWGLTDLCAKLRVRCESAGTCVLKPIPEPTRTRRTA